MIIFNDCFVRNSLSLAMMQNLIDDIKRYENDINLRAIVLSGDGNIFSAGHNLKELVSNITSSTSIFEKLILFIDK